MHILSVKLVLWLVVNLHHVLLDGAAMQYRVHYRRQIIYSYERDIA